MSANTHFPYPISLILLPTIPIVCLHAFSRDFKTSENQIVLLCCCIRMCCVMFPPSISSGWSLIHLPAVRPQCARSAKFFPIRVGMPDPWRPAAPPSPSPVAAWPATAPFCFRRMKVFVDGALTRETGDLRKGLRLRLFDHVEVECRLCTSLLSDGLSITIDGQPVEGCYADPLVIMHRGRIPAGAFTVLLCLTTLFLFQTNARNANFWQKPFYVLSTAAMFLFTSTWQQTPELCVWGTLSVGFLETFGAASTVMQTVEASHLFQLPNAIGVVVVIALFALRLFFLHLVLLCLP